MVRQFLLFFFGLISLSGCQQKGWIYKEVCSDCPSFNSAFLCHTTTNTFNGIEIQFLKGEFGTLGFLNVYSRQISSPYITIDIEGEQHIFEAYLMQGNQRLLLPEPATYLLIDSILSERKITVYFDEYYTEFFPENFGRKYRLFNQKCI